MSSGFFEDDGEGNLQPLDSLTGVTDMWFELDGEGNIIPRETEANPNYPSEPDVRDGVHYGYAFEYTGSLSGSGGTSTTPFWMSVMPVPATASWLVSVGNVAIDATVYVYDYDTDALLYTLSRSSGQVPQSSVDLGGKVVYCKVKEGALDVSARFPLTTGVLVQALPLPGAQPTQIDGLMTEVLQPDGAENAQLLGFKDARQKTYLNDGSITGNLSGQPL